MSVQFSPSLPRQHGHLDHGEWLAISLGDIKDVARPKDQLPLGLAVLPLYLLGHGHDDLDGLLPSSDVAVHLQPGVVACHLGGIGTLSKDEGDVGPGVAMKSRLDIQVGSEAVRVLNCTNCLL
jgi:hypothetical protein